MGGKGETNEAENSTPDRGYLSLERIINETLIMEPHVVEGVG